MRNCHCGGVATVKTAAPAYYFVSCSKCGWETLRSYQQADIEAAWEIPVPDKYQWMGNGANGFDLCGRSVQITQNPFFIDLTDVGLNASWNVMVKLSGAAHGTFAQYCSTISQNKKLTAIQLTEK